MNGMSSVWIYSGYNSGSGITYTHEWNFAPSFTVAYPVIYGVSGGGLHHSGIAAYRHRPKPNGAEETVNLGAWPSWAAYIYVNQLTSVTFGVAVGAKQELYVHGNISFW
jgi:hypothetical protein